MRPTALSAPSGRRGHDNRLSALVDLNVLHGYDLPVSIAQPV
jgi:hypothetical protein